MERGRLLVAVNLAARRQSVPLPSKAAAAIVMLASVSDISLDGHTSINLPPDSVAILTS